MSDQYDVIGESEDYRQRESESYTAQASGKHLSDICWISLESHRFKNKNCIEKINYMVQSKSNQNR